MLSDIYIERKLKSNDEVIKESEIFKHSKCIVILAEPGAGKTRLLSHIAKQYNTKKYRANVFIRKSIISKHDYLIVDGIDEVAKIDKSAIENVFAKVDKASPQHVVFASRASEWDERFNGLIRDFIEIEPVIIRLMPFDLEEQNTLFTNLFPNQNFTQFVSQANEFELDKLLENPLFMELIAKSYFKNNKQFSSKASMFEDATLCLAGEHNNELPSDFRPTNAEIIVMAGEIFSKLLLSGSAGVSINETLADINFPFLYSLCSIERGKLKYLLDAYSHASRSPNAIHRDHSIPSMPITFRSKWY